MNKKIVNIIEPLLVFILLKVINSLKPLFISEDARLQEKLRKYGFHVALCNHPSILFGYRNTKSNQKCLLLSLKVWYLLKCIRLGLLKHSNKYKILDFFSISSCYGNGVEFWFEESHSPIIQYNIPENNLRLDKKIAIYTALTGNYDLVNEILYKEDCVDYFLFTNNHSIKSRTWNVIYIESELDNKLLSREIKMFPHKYLDNAYDISIYIDANAVIYGELSKLTSYLSNSVSFVVSKHGERDSIFQEVNRIIEVFSYVNKDEAIRQYNSYITKGFVDNLGLAECSILIRNHNELELQNLMQMWWNEFVNGIRRDQISLIPCIYLQKYKKYRLINGYVRHNQFCKIVAHNKN